MNSFWISKLAAEQGFKVALSGQGGDELFGGYTSWKWFNRFERIAAWTGRFPSRCSHLFDRELWPYRWRKLSYLFGTTDPFVASQMAVRILFLKSDVSRLLTSPLAETDTTDEVGDYLRNCSPLMQQDSQAKLSLMDIVAHLQPRLLRDLDAMSMFHSLEVRPAFLDDRVVEFVLSMRGRGRPKSLLLQAMKRFMSADLLADLASRAKRTFTFPFSVWLSRHLRPAIAEALSTPRLAKGGVLQPAEARQVWERYQRSPEMVGWSRAWSLFVLARWCEVMNLRP